MLPERLDAEYVNASAERIRPVIIHHAVLGSLERFTAILLEHHQGSLPFWLAPEQIVVAPVTDDQIEYARHVTAELEGQDLRVMLDDRSEHLSRRLVYALERRIPVFVTVGAREQRDGTVSVRRRSGNPAAMTLQDAVQQFRSEARL